MPVVLSKHQFDAVKRSEYNRFVDDFAKEAAQSWPQSRAVFPTWQAWRGEIARLIELAREDGLEVQREVRAHAAITLEKGQDFWGRADVRALLSRPHLSTPTLRLFALLHHLETGEIW